jgi:lipopolysaccharide/colanic/teichoic acid biosynthesis glycosyltransferase
VFYLHERVGKEGKLFNVIKFRTMNIDERPLEEIFTPEQMEEYKEHYKVKDDPRVTKFGKILRKISLDELPQLINIIRGQMSFVGPRPVMEEEIERLKKELKVRDVESEIIL